MVMFILLGFFLYFMVAIFANVNADGLLWCAVTRAGAKCVVDLLLQLLHQWLVFCVVALVASYFY